ncbi:hypothetical protein AUEXF2481DRAFT_299851 [Aureobasidium subglaciale EXF-2481]|uniref:Uncharacterized protein n=1 Tax=Aureobasidium subglaciale (strain EXF-2481) TaxID=1043005 RepID=A0A074YCH7_AURSE|nr:uncharacterized protein AUEXF2481DRAFT_299851 [Aureobasidium subglaciale EXF-2481]KEQ93724.1 hypothetical protein AUEXF2481DRAFT_299851 [Aureobasidium subglaciale EXF-2481]
MSRLRWCGCVRNLDLLGHRQTTLLSFSSDCAAALAGCSITAILHALSKEETRTALTTVDSGNGPTSYSPWRI